MTVILNHQGRYCSSRSAPTPCGVSAGKIGKCVTALRHRFRPALSLTSLLVFTREANAHVSAEVRSSSRRGQLEGGRLLRTVLLPWSRRWSPQSPSASRANA